MYKTKFDLRKFMRFEEYERENKACIKPNLISENLCVWKILDNLKVHTFALRIAADVADFKEVPVGPSRYIVSA